LHLQTDMHGVRIGALAHTNKGIAATRYGTETDRQTDDRQTDGITETRQTDRHTM
jgi:hypothetical protein